MENCFHHTIIDSIAVVNYTYSLIDNTVVIIQAPSSSCSTMLVCMLILTEVECLEENLHQIKNTIVILHIRQKVFSYRRFTSFASEEREEGHGSGGRAWWRELPATSWWDGGRMRSRAKFGRVDFYSTSILLLVKACSTFDNDTIDSSRLDLD